LPITKDYFIDLLTQNTKIASSQGDESKKKKKGGTSTAHKEMRTAYENFKIRIPC